MSDQIPEHLVFVGEGWHPLLMRLHGQLLDAAPGYVISQVKEKYGGLRVYLELTETENGWLMPEGVDALIEAAEEESLHTCEFCGAPGEPRPGGWVKTLCDACAGSKRTASCMQWARGDD